MSGPAVVVGARGQLGADLVDALRWEETEVVEWARADLDVADRDAVFRAVRRVRPDAVYNTAAFHRVDDCEADPTEAYRVNVLGAAHLADACREVGARYVWFSTDYVFPGSRGRDLDPPYTESSHTRPLSVYGHSKRAGEALVLHRYPGALVVRTAWLFGRRASGKGFSFPERVVGAAREGRALDVVDDQVGSPTSTADVARAVCGADGHRAGLLHVVNSGVASWHDLARETLRLAGYDPGVVRPVATVETIGRARRPRFSALASERGVVLRPWSEALAEYLTARGLVRREAS